MTEEQKKMVAAHPFLYIAGWLAGAGGVVAAVFLFGCLIIAIVKGWVGFWRWL